MLIKNCVQEREKREGGWGVRQEGSRPGQREETDRQTDRKRMHNAAPDRLPVEGVLAASKPGDKEGEPRPATKKSKREEGERKKKKKKNKKKKKKKREKKKGRIANALTSHRGLIPQNPQRPVGSIKTVFFGECQK